MPEPVKRKSPRQAVLVMGMHRSGTSALSGILGKLGVQPPRTLMRPTDDNPRGYWESTKLMVFHDELLRSAGSTWSDWDAFNPDWIQSSVAETFRDRLPEIIEHEFGDAPLFLVKDPRISRFARFWLDALPSLSIVPKVVICVRHPREVVQSLEKRDHFARKRAQLIWLRHMLDAEYATRGASRCFVHYTDLLGEWATQVRRIGRELDIPWPRWSSNVEIEIDQYLTSSLRRNVAEAGEVADDSVLGNWVATSYRVLRKLAEGGEHEPGLLAQLDAVREAFDESSATYGAVLREQERKAGERIADLSRDLAKETQQADALQALQDKLAFATAALSEREDEVRRLRDEHAVAAAASEAAQRELHARLQLLCEERTAASSDAAAAIAERDEALERLAAARDADARQHADMLAGERKAQAETVQRLSASHAQAMESLRDEHAMALDKQERAREALEATLEERSMELAHLSRLLLAEESKAEALEGRLADMETANVAALEARDAAHQQAVDSLQRAAAAKLGEADAAHARQLEELREAHEQSIAARQAGEKRLREATAAHERRIAELRAENAVVAAAMERALGEKQQELEHLQQRMDKALAARESRFEEQSRHHARELTRSQKLAAERQVLLDAVIRELQLHRDQIRKLSAELAGLRHRRNRQPIGLPWLDRKRPKAAPVETLPVQEQARIIRESGRFDAAWYLSGNPDVVAKRLDPVLHYLEHGAREGRRPAPDFDAVEYAHRHGLPDAGVNPLLHLVVAGGAGDDPDDPGRG
jgi:hypothetical protein